MFREVVERMRGAEGYYASMAHELREGTYPVASVFNWRFPTLYVALANVPTWLSFAVMASLSVMVVTLLMVHLARNGSPEGTIIGVLLTVTAATSLVDRQGYWMTEAWSGLLIGLSLCAYLWKRWTAAAVLGLLALYVRELAALYCVICFALAVRSGRRREATVWLGGFASFGILYAIHVSEVLGEIRADDLTHPQSWIQFGGLAFWMSTLRINRALLIVPQLVVALSCVLIAASLWSRSAPQQLRWALVAYSLFFCVAGWAFNNYWGLVSIFLSAVGIAHGAEGLESLVRQAIHGEKMIRERVFQES